MRLRVGDLHRPERRKWYTRSRREKRKKMHRCALVAKQNRAELTLWGNVKCTRRNGTCSRDEETKKKVTWRSCVHVFFPFFFSFFFLNHNFYFPAQLVGGFTLSDLLDKPWSQVSSLLPPRTCSIFIAHRVQHSHCSSTFIECCKLMFSRFPLINSLCKKKSLRVCARGEN